MRPRPLHLLALAVLFSPIACQLTRPMPAPLSRGAAQAIQYTGAVSRESWITTAIPEADTRPEPDTRPKPDTRPEPTPQPEDIVHLETAVYVIDRKAANHLLSLPYAGLVAAEADHVQSQKALASLIQQGAATLLTREEIGCIDRSRATLSLVRQKSYLQGYDLLGIEDAMIADPKVGIVEDGMLLDIRPTRSKDRSALELGLKLTLTRLQSPLPTVRVPGRLPTEPGLLMELPVFANERLETTASLPSDKTLFFGGLASRGGGDQLVIVFLREVQNPTAVTAVRSGTPTAGSALP